MIAGWYLFVASAVLSLIVYFAMLKEPSVEEMYKPDGHKRYLVVMSWLKDVLSTMTLVGGLVIASGYILKLYKRAE